MSHLLSCLGGNIWLAVLPASKDLGQECSACKGFIPSLGGSWVLGIGLLGALKTFGVGAKTRFRVQLGLKLYLDKRMVCGPGRGKCTKTLKWCWSLV